jgi:hypothetical protein
MNDQELRLDALSNVPAVTPGFWIIKVLATSMTHLQSPDSQFERRLGNVRRLRFVRAIRRRSS